MTKRTPSVSEYCHIVDIIKADNFQHFVMYFSGVGNGYNLDILDLSTLPREYQLPLIYTACLYSNHIATYLIENMQADVVNCFQGSSVLLTALEPKNQEPSIYVVQLILDKMLRANVKVPYQTINYVDTRLLFEPENWIFTHISKAIDDHNAALELARFGSVTRESPAIKSVVPQALTVCAKAAPPFMPKFDMHLLDYDRNKQAIHRTTRQLAQALSTVMQGMRNNDLSRISIATNETIAHFKTLRQFIAGDLTLPQMYLKYGHCFPEHFMRLEVDLLRTYIDFCSRARYTADYFKAELLVLGQIIGAETIEIIPPSQFRQSLTAT